MVTIHVATPPPPATLALHRQFIKHLMWLTSHCAPHPPRLHEWTRCCNFRINFRQEFSGISFVFPQRSNMFSLPRKLQSHASKLGQWIFFFFFFGKRAFRLKWRYLTLLRLLITKIYFRHLRAMMCAMNGLLCSSVIFSFFFFFFFFGCGIHSARSPIVLPPATCICAPPLRCGFYKYLHYGPLIPLSDVF